MKLARKRKTQVCFTLLNFGKLVLSMLLRGNCTLIVSTVLRRLTCSWCVDNSDRNSYVSCSWAVLYKVHLIWIMLFVKSVFQTAFLSARNRF